MTNETFADRLRQAMAERGLKQADLVHGASARGEKLGKSQVSQYVSGKGVPRANVVALLAAHLDVDGAWLAPGAGTRASARPETASQKPAARTSDSLYLSLSGEVDKAFPVAGSDDEVMLTLYLEADDFAFDWDEDGYAADCVTSLADLPEDTELVSAAFVFEADVEAEDFPAVLAEMAEALSSPGDVDSVTGTSSEIVDEFCALQGVSEDECSTSVYGDATYDSLYVSYDGGAHLDLTRYSSGDTEVSISLYFK